VQRCLHPYSRRHWSASFGWQRSRVPQHEVASCTQRWWHIGCSCGEHVPSSYSQYSRWYALSSASALPLSLSNLEPSLRWTDHTTRFTRFLARHQGLLPAYGSDKVGGPCVSKGAWRYERSPDSLGVLRRGRPSPPSHHTRGPMAKMARMPRDAESSLLRPYSFH
jgi:hypothetical protein